MSAPNSDENFSEDLTPKDKAWWVECIASFAEEGVDGDAPSGELVARIDDAFEKGREHIRQVISKGRSEADEKMNSMLTSISDRLESIEKRLDSDS